MKPEVKEIDFFNDDSGNQIEFKKLAFFVKHYRKHVL